NTIKDDLASRIPRLKPEVVVNWFKESKKKKLILVDYDGTLTSAHRLPEYAAPSEPVLERLRRLAQQPDTFVYVLSGRSRAHLDLWFDNIPVGVSAEHGCFYRHPPAAAAYIESLAAASASAEAGGTGLVSSDSNASLPGLSGAAVSPTASALSLAAAGGGTARAPRRIGDGWLTLVDQIDPAWRDELRPLFQHYTERTPGSSIEEKEINLTWDYREADPEFGSWQAAELHVNLEKILSHLPVSVILGQKTLEVRPSMVDKANAVRAVLADLGGARASFDFFMCVGDGKTDEVVFQFLNELDAVAAPPLPQADASNTLLPPTEAAPAIVTCTVGKKRSEARYYLDSVRDVESLLDRLGNLK
ncbi:Trehalose-6-P synthase/phosphatase complex synthase subunit, partial [Cladochytrium tenue]